MVKLGFDGHVLTGKPQGIRTTLSNLLAALADTGAVANIAVLSDAPDAARARLEALAPSTSGRLAYLQLPYSGAIARLLWHFPRVFRRYQLDYAIFNYIAPPFSRKAIVIIHDILPLTHSNYFPWAFRWRSIFSFSLSIWRARLVISVSNYTEQSLLSYFGPGIAKKLCTVPNGPSFKLETYFAPRAPVSAGRPFILCVGRIEARKNVNLLVAAFLMADLPWVDLVFVGAIDHNFAFTLPDDPRIQQRVGVDDEGLIDLYRRAKLFVYPSFAEGFGLPLLDAVLFGVPTISSNQTAMPEVAGNLAEYFNPTGKDAVEVLAARLAGHFSDDPVPAPSEEARKVHAARMSWKAAAAQFLEAVEALPTDRCGHPENIKK